MSFDRFINEHTPQVTYWNRATIKALAEKAGLDYSEEERYNDSWYWSISIPGKPFSTFSRAFGDDKELLGVGWWATHEGLEVINHVTYKPHMIEVRFREWTDIEYSSHRSALWDRLLKAAGITAVVVSLPEPAVKLPVPDWGTFDDSEYSFASEAVVLLKQLRRQVTRLINKAKRSRAPENPARAE